jgi:hypothetical protein
MYQCAVPSAPAYAHAGEEKGAVIKTFDPPQRISAKDVFASDGHRWLRFTEEDQSTPRPAEFIKWPIFLTVRCCGA